jgi:hypothetical protein
MERFGRPYSHNCRDIICAHNHHLHGENFVSRDNRPIVRNSLAMPLQFY